MTPLAVIIVYLGLVLLVGGFSHRLFRGTGEDYFLATRSIGPFVLLMSLFGTHMTSFTMLGGSGESYHRGIGVFALMASGSALMAPLIFFLLGPRLWAVGKRYHFVTQVEYFRHRWDSDALGLLLFAVLVALVIPYLLIGIMAGGITLREITGLPEWLGGLLVTAVVLAYVTYGGLRGTAWANTFQTLVFMTLGAVAFFVVVGRLGGFEKSVQEVALTRPDLLTIGAHFNLWEILTYMMIPLSTCMFPHLFMHWLSARDSRSFRATVSLYPICIAVVWVPSVLLGVFGNISFPGLEGPQANSVLVRMIDSHAPEFLAGLLAAGVFAAIMSSLDSQVLSVGSMFTNDIVKHYGFHDHMDERWQVLAGRLFVVAILAVTFLLSLSSDRSIFRLGIWSFTGFAALLPLPVAALFWKRSTKTGAMASILSVVFLWVFFFLRAGGSDYTVAGSGIMPVAVILLVSSLVMVLVSLVTSPPRDEVVSKFFS